MIEYPFEYFEDEVREGFYVSSLVKRSWAAQLEILWLISDICDKHNLKWYADSGTLLGAVRHQGFIPWDDDVDIAMLRTDYDKFIEIVEQELPPGFILRSPYSETPFYELFSRIVHTGMTNVDDKPHELLHEFPFPAGVDIFPMDNISLNAEEEKARLQVLRGLGGVLHNLDKDENLSIEEAVREIEKWLNCSINRELPKRQQVYICMEKCAKAFKNKPATYVANIQWYMKGKNDKCHKSCFSEIITLPFENMSMRAPINYDEILKSEYGQYQTVVKAGGDHGYPYFNKYEDMIEEQQGEYIYRYKFSPDDISDDTRQHSDSLYSKTSKFVSMARKVADVVTVKLASNDLSGLEKVFQSCQTAAINTGEMIEGKMGYSTQTVACLESYCESVYQLYEALLNDSQGVNDALSDMNKTIAELEDYTDTEIKDFKEVVFLVYRSKYWDFYDSKWKQAVDAGYKVTVIPAPYYEVKADGSFGEMHCDIDGYPEYVEITSYESYDFEANHPDVIYIQNPYDRCNRVINLPPYYYAANLRNFTEELIYIPFFIIDEIDNALAKQTMNYFCKTPGVVCSDLVLVQSEQMRQSYIECLTEFAGEEYRELWEKKIQVQ